jgi:hypothetical protein
LLQHRQLQTPCRGGLDTFVGGGSARRDAQGLRKDEGRWSLLLPALGYRLFLRSTSKRSSGTASWVCLEPSLGVSRTTDGLLAFPSAKVDEVKDSYKAPMHYQDVDGRLHRRACKRRPETRGRNDQHKPCSPHCEPTRRTQHLLLQPSSEFMKLPCRRGGSTL